MLEPSEKRPDISVVEPARESRPVLNYREAQTLRELRRRDSGDGVQKSMAELGQLLQPDRPLSARHMQRLVASLMAKDCIHSSGRPGGGPHMLHTRRRSGGAA